MAERATRSPEQIEQQLMQELRLQDPEVQIRIRQASLGWLYLQIISIVFAEQEQFEREQYIDNILTAIGLELNLYPFLDCKLQTPQEAAEDEQEPFQSISVPLWSEILLAPQPDNPIPIDKSITNRPLVVTFYSFKGGVGRSTALAFVANILATRGQRVVMMDFDVEAPGLSFMSSSGSSKITRYGVLDYLHQHSLTPNEKRLPIAECIHRIDMPTRGELYLMPAGEYAQGYIHRLTDLDVRLFYRGEVNPMHQLLDDIKAHLDPDVIFIDARTGFTDIGAVALFDKADLGIICFSPTEQSFAGLQWIVEAASKQRKYRGFPDLRFLLTPMPPVAQSLQDQWLARTAAWISDHWELPSSIIVEDIYYKIPYNPYITALTNLFDEMPVGILEPYVPVADTISACLPQEEDALLPDLVDQRAAILSQLKFETRSAQEIELENIAQIFQPTGDFSRFFEERTWFIRGAQGTGKTLLFRLFIEKSDDAWKFSRSSRYWKRNVDFIPGYGPTGLGNTLLTSTDLSNYEPPSRRFLPWWAFWEGYLLLQLVAAFPDVQELPDINAQLVTLVSLDKPQPADILRWLDEYSLVDEHLQSLSVIDEWLQRQGRKVWVLYDELDMAFGQNANRRRLALDGLLAWWMEMGPSFSKSIMPKIFLREDVWSELEFANSFASARSIQLRWQEEDLWRLVLRQALNTSPILADLVGQYLGIGLKGLNNIEKGQLQKGLSVLWGERIESGNKAYTHTWVSNRMSDSQNNRFPRSLLQLLEHTIAVEKEAVQQDRSDIILRSKALVEALPLVSEQRVMEMRNTYPELTGLLDKLRGERSPIAFDRLGEIWQKSGDELKSVIAKLTMIGILKEHFHASDVNVPRYTVAELYLYGLGMKRQGQR